MQSLREWKAAHHEYGCQENFFFSVQCAARPKNRILLNHGPDFSLDPIVDRGIEDNRAAQEIRASGWKICANRALDVPRSDALRGCESGGQDGVAEAVRGSARGERTTKKESHKVVTFVLCCGKRPELHLPRKVSKSIRD